MIVEYRLLQFRELPERQEGRNFALMAKAEGQTHVRAIGLKRNGFIDLNYYRAIAPHQSQEHWVFGEWLQWLQDFATWSDAWNPEHPISDQIFDRIALEGRQITATPSRWEDWPDVNDVNILLDSLEERLIGTMTKPPEKPFSEWIDDVFSTSELAYRKGFARGVEVAFEMPGGKPFVTTFPYAITEEPRMGFKAIAFHGAKKDIQQKVNDALLSFQRAVESGFLVKERCIVLTQTIPKVNKIYAEELEELAQLVNVTAKDAPDLLRKMAA
ncbi:MAG: hypothetical protein JJ714_05790 [Acidithiobacillus sp.]|nr:hypothetical protein [Acidithiobacillus sp.]